MQKFLISSLILVAICFSLLLIPQASALPVSYNQTTINLGLSSSVRNSSSYDVFTLNQDNWLWEKFDNNTVDSSPLSITGTITYNTNLKKLFKFDSSLVDQIGHGNAVITGSTTYVSGQEANAFSFDTSSYATISGTGLPNGTSDRSISFWYKTPSTFTSGKFIASWGTETNHGIFGLSTFDTSGTQSRIDAIEWGIADHPSSTFLQINTWYYITYTLSSTGATTNLYINGVEDANFPINSQAFNTASTSLWINNDSSLGRIAGGVIDEFRVYNVALNLAQSKALYMVGHYSQSHTFDGGEYLTTSTLPAPVGTNDRTFTFWIKAPTPTGTEGIMGYGTGGVTNQAVIIQLLTTNQILFAGWANDQSSTGSITPNVWSYVAIVLSNGGTTRTFYINGVLDRSVTTTALNTVMGNNALNIGFDAISGFGGSSQLIGQLDNLKVYPYALTSSQINSDYNSISPISSGKQFMSWYHGVSGSSTMTNKIGPGSASLTLACSPSSTLQYLIGYNPNISYLCQGNPATFYFNSIMSNTNTIVWHAPTAAGSSTLLTPFVSKAKLMTFSLDDGATAYITTSSGNTSSLGGPSAETMSNQRVNMNLGMFKYHFNGTSLVSSAGTDCDLLFLPTNTTKSIDSIACDRSVPANTVRYWNGMNIQGSAIYYTNSTKSFLTSIDNAQYKKLLSLPCVILVNETPCETFIMTDFNNKDFFVVLTATHVYYRAASEANSLLLNENYALQSYDVVTPVTTSAFEIPNNPLLQSMTLYGFNVNQTLSKTGLFTIPSGYTFRSTIVTPSVRLIDPRWTNDATDIPTIYTTSSLFPIFLNVANAPSFSAIKVTQGNQIINNLESIYAVAQLDSTRSVEVDLPPGVCANVYIADISTSPSIWNFQGIICATGVNQKTLAYTNTLPLTFFTLKYGVTNSYNPNNNALTVTTRTTTAPFTYNVIVKNSTGAIAINSTFTIPANQTIQTNSFNVSGVTKPAGLFVTTGGSQIYSSYLGSPLSLASMASFFHQYFNYQGFDFLSFIPLIFASMFTRSTVGIGMALTVVLIATLSFLSVVVVSDTTIFISVVIAAVGMIGYRGYQAYG